MIKHISIRHISNPPKLTKIQIALISCLGLPCQGLWECPDRTGFGSADLTWRKLIQYRIIVNMWVNKQKNCHNHFFNHIRYTNSCNHASFKFLPKWELNTNNQFVKSDLHIKQKYLCKWLNTTFLITIFFKTTTY